MSQYSKNKNRGMTFLELTVVISIFAIVSSITIFNYKTFQAKVDLRNLTNDVATKFTQAQRRAMFGGLHPQASLNWKPAYGLSFNLASTADTDNQTFYYFADLDQELDFDTQLYNCDLYSSGECLEKISMNRGNYIQSIRVYFANNPIPQNINSSIDIIYTRPSAMPKFNSPEILEPLLSPISYVEFTVANQFTDLSTKVHIYASGRVEVK